MAFLDRFRPQPRWKHADPLVRLTGVEEVSADDHATLAAIAREDPDARVRRAAVVRLTDLPALADIARQDGEAAVRDAAVARLVEAVVEAPGAAEAEAGLTAITDAKHLVTIARSAGSEAVRLAAVARLDDPRQLGSVARHAADAATRLQALERIHDSAEVVVVALKSEHKDVALAALETIDDPDALKAIATRGRNKIAVRRARAKLRQLEETPRPPSAEEIRARRVEVCQRVDGLTILSNSESVRDALDAAALAWRELAGDDDPELAAQFAAACTRVRERLSSQERERAQDEERRALVRAALAEREAICARAEALAGEGIAAGLEDVRQAWTQLPSMDEAQATDVARRFERATRDAEGRLAAWEADRARRDRLIAVCDEAAKIVEGEDLTAARAAYGALKRGWTNEQVGSVGSVGSISAELEGRFRQAGTRLTAREAEREAEVRQSELRRQQDNATRLARLCERADAAARTADLSLKDAERLVRDVRAAIDEPGALPSKRDEDDLTRRLKAVHAALVPRLQELRQMDDWQRWANVTIQEELCARTEALIDVPDIPRVARELQELREKWKGAAAVPKEQAGALWTRFKAAQDKARARCDAYFAEQSRERAANLARKVALAERAEVLAPSTDWIKTAQELQRLQEDWKTIGPVPHQDAKAIWQRFRSACNAFFTRRHEDLAHRKEEWASNLARKEALCQQAEVHAESVDWDRTAVAIRQLQAEWKAVGAVKRTKSDAIWQRFRAACDRFFERYKHRDQIDRAATQGERDALCVALEQLLPQPPALEDAAGAASVASDPPTPQDINRAIRDIRAKWQAAGPPIAMPRADYERLSARFSAALVSVALAYPEAVRGSELDPELNQHRMERLCERVEGFLPKSAIGEAGDASPAAILARQLREALATNTIGGRVDEEARWRTASEEVKRAQSEWRQIGPVPETVHRALTDRFQRACTRFFDLRPRVGSAS